MTRIQKHFVHLIEDAFKSEYRCTKNVNICEQILAAHAQIPQVAPGDFIECVIDTIMVHEQLGGRISPEFRSLGRDRIHDPSKIVFILDHWVPPPDVRAAKMHQIANKFAQDFHFIHNLGQTQGICHQVLPEKGFALPGRLIIGSDSHSTTYGVFNCLGTGVGATDIAIVFATGKLWFRVPESIRIDFSGNLAPKSMGKDVVLQLLRDFRIDGANYECFEFGGPGLSALSVDARMSIANMTVEMGAKAGIFEGDLTLSNWLRPRIPSKGKTKALYFLKATSDAQYKSHHNYLLSDIPPLVAKPYRPDNVVPVSELGHVELNEAFLGSCTNGRLEDLRIAARIVKGQHVPSRVKFIVIPASREIYQQAMQEGLLAIFVDAGAMVEYPTCGPCIGGSMGVLGPNEVCISASNRNFIGRMGDPTSQSYLASPAVVAASAITGYITEPIKPIWGEGGI